MVKLATVRLRNKKTKRIVVVNAIDYATDLGKHEWRDYELVTESRGDEQTPKQEKDAQAEYTRNQEKIRADQKADLPLEVPAKKDVLTPAQRKNEFLKRRNEEKVESATRTTRRTRVTGSGRSKGE